MNDYRVLVIDRLNRTKEFIPFFVGIAYLFGFVIVNSYLSKYHINGTSFFASEYLIAGTIFTLIFSILFLTVYFSNRHSDKLTTNIFEFELPALVRILLLMFSFCFLIIDDSIVTPKIVQIYNYLNVFIWFTFSLIGLAKLSNVVRFSIFFILIFGCNIFVFVVCKECRFLQGMILFYGLLAISEFNAVFEKNYQVAQALGSILVLISMSMIFGYGVYDNIAKRFGGGKPENVTLLIDIQKLNYIPSNIRVIEVNKLKAQLIHVSDREYSIKQDSNCFTLNKELFFGYINKK